MTTLALLLVVVMADAGQPAHTVSELVESRIRQDYCGEDASWMPPDTKTTALGTIPLPGYVGELDWPGFAAIPEFTKAFWYVTGGGPHEPGAGIALLLDPCVVVFLDSDRGKAFAGLVDFDSLKRSEDLALDLGYAAVGLTELDRVVGFGPYIDFSTLAGTDQQSGPYYGCVIVKNQRDLGRFRSPVTVEAPDELPYEPHVYCEAAAVTVEFLCRYDDLDSLVYLKTVRIAEDSIEVLSKNTGLCSAPPY